MFLSGELCYSLFMRTVRLLDIIQLFRQHRGILRAEDIATELDVSVRTIYRDIAALKALRIPISGEAGVGYMLGADCDLPPLHFDFEEIEAISLGLSLLVRTGDTSLQQAAQRVERKISETAPMCEHLFASPWGMETPITISITRIRAAIRDENKLKLHYCDVQQQPSVRTVLPLALMYYTESILLAAWCVLRKDFRHFRLDRIDTVELLSEGFHGQGDTLRQQWQQKHFGW